MVGPLGSLLLRLSSFFLSCDNCNIELDINEKIQIILRRQWNISFRFFHTTSFLFFLFISIQITYLKSLFDDYLFYNDVEYLIKYILSSAAQAQCRTGTIK